MCTFGNFLPGNWWLSGLRVSEVSLLGALGLPEFLEVTMRGREAYFSTSLTHLHSYPPAVPHPRLLKLPGSSCPTCGPARSCRESSDR